MAEEVQTPQEEITKRLKDLEEKVSPHLDGLPDQMDTSFWDNMKAFFMLLWTNKPSDNIEYMPELIDAVTAEGVKRAEAQKEIMSTTTLLERIEAETDPKQIVALYESWMDGFPIMKWLMGVLSFVTGFSMIILATTSANKELFWQSTWKRVRPALAPFEGLLAYIFNHPEELENIKEELTKYGYRDETIEQLIEGSRQKLNPEQARDAFLRGLIEETELDRQLEANRYTDETKKLLKKLYELIPPVGDLITMAVREVFSPEIAERFGQFEGFPPEFEEWAGKQGLTPEWARNYWAAHWNLPSANQGFEMLHRGVIDYEDLELLLRALDVMPFWRDKLVEIAYSPFTRVDVRRMYALGILDESQVKQAYLDIGYDDFKAGKMTEFTVAYTTEQERDLTKADIVGMFKRSVLTAEEAIPLLIELGYSEINASLLIERAIYEVYEEIKDKRVEATRKLFVAGRITESDVYSRLGQFNLPADEMSALIDLWIIEKEGKVRYFTVDQLQDFFKGRVLSKTETETELKNLGFTQANAELFTRLWAKG